MTRKTVKDLDAEFTLLKEEQYDLKTKYDELETKYETLEKNYEECLSRKNTTFNCGKCNEVFESLVILNKHKKNHNKSNAKLRCDECERTFDEDWKLNAHMKTHKKYTCDQCDKAYKFQDILEKHVKIVHENVKLFCTYFNNQLECPYAQECVFLHEDSEMCKFGKGCERNNCMFMHNSDTNKDVVDEEIVNVNNITEDDDEEHNNEEEIEIETCEKTFVNPSQIEQVIENDFDDNISDEKENNDLEIISSKCDKCNFETTDLKRFIKHTFEIHSKHGKYVCFYCHEEFDNRKWFNSHNYRGCNPFTVDAVNKNKPVEGAL